MPPCPTCGAEMNFISEYGEWFCPRCHDYVFRQLDPLQPEYRQEHQPQTPPSETGGTTFLIYVLIGIFIIVVVGILLYAAVVPDDSGSGDYYDHYYYGGWEYDEYPYYPEEEVAKLPTIELTLKNNGSNDTLWVKHTQGDPLDWSKYKMIITNNTDETDVTTMIDLSSLGQIITGDQSVLDSNVPGFSVIDYKRGLSYTFEIYNLKENKRVFAHSNIICE